MLDVKKIKTDFPIFNRKINGHELVYLDNAAMSQKPKHVINAIVDFYENHNANVHRGIHTLSEEATDLYENARKKVAEFIGAVRTKEIVFTKGSTESLNMVAFSWAAHNLKKGDQILVTEVEHHSNLVPWQIAAELSGAELRVLDFNFEVESDFMNLLQKEMTDRVKILSLTHASNVTGTINPIKEITKLAKKVGSRVSVDGAQSIPHMEVNVQQLGCDFFSFSSHKMLGPTGVGVLWAKEELLKEMAPVQYGGGMIDVVKETKSTRADPPEKFEAGTPNVAGVIGLGAAIDYLNTIGMKNIREHEISLNIYAFEKMTKIKNLHILGLQDPKIRTGIISFVVKDIHAHDLASILNSYGVAVRSGHHCAMPLHVKLDIPASTRASYYLYNTQEDIDRLVEGIYKAIEILD